MLRVKTKHAGSRGLERLGERPTLPPASETLYEIGVVLAVHLAFAVAVLLTLQAFGVS